MIISIGRPLTGRCTQYNGKIKEFSLSSNGFGHADLLFVTLSAKSSLMSPYIRLLLAERVTFSSV